MNSVINEISSNSKLLLETSGVLGEAADNTDKTMNEVSATVNQMVEIHQYSQPIPKLRLTI